MLRLGPKIILRFMMAANSATSCHTLSSCLPLRPLLDLCDPITYSMIFMMS